MKKLFTFFFIFLNLHLLAQKKLIALNSSGSIKPDIEKVVRDYYDHFYNIKGAEIYETANTIEYESKIKPRGATQSTITEIKGLQGAYSWQATLLMTEDYEEAIEKYKQIYHQLNDANFAMPENKIWKFKGPYDAPNEGRSFASSILQPDVNEKFLQRLKIEVAINYNMNEWTVKVLVYEKENDADIRPSENTLQ